jgi:hypothetical protein
MTDSLVNVLVPYSRFLKCQDRRHRIAAELTRRDQPPTIDADVMPAPAEMASTQPLTVINADH